MQDLIVARPQFQKPRVKTSIVELSAGQVNTLAKKEEPRKHSPPASAKRGRGLHLEQIKEKTSGLKQAKKYLKSGAKSKSP